MSLLLDVIRKTFVFEGRARRKEFWMYHLQIILISIAASVLLAIFSKGSSEPSGILLGLFGIGSLVLGLPTIALSIRRLHDTDRSGWFLLLEFVPILGLIVLVFFLQEGTPGNNRFGPSPKLLPANAI